MNDRIADIIARAKAMGIIRRRRGRVVMACDAVAFRRITQDRIVALGMTYGDAEHDATEYAVWLRDHPKFQCCYCNKRVSAGHRRIDHFCPLARGGAHEVPNLVPACAQCNSRKGAKELHARPVVLECLMPYRWKASVVASIRLTSWKECQPTPIDLIWEDEWFAAWCRKNG